ncbi:hypothetical protein fugu_012622 [Takifugu bimaculatus]|uniref:FAM13A-like domain-containing protein n=1 Tax=Takifugu bimaculatus TaxID=433685 RepID=A0A4Z2C5W7_9TELE|nr:hypothetical protein fugu_012622 [Takifugu bimaculatus]
MFCFCFQSPSLKLQALEADLGPQEASVAPESHDIPPAQHQALAAAGKSLLLHPPPSPHTEDQHIKDPSQPAPQVLQPAPLLSQFTMMDNPILSPRCPSLSHSLRYNLDPDAAPSPPCSQHIHMARSSVLVDPGEGSVSISVLNRHIHSLRKRIRQFEEHFEQEKHYKPAHNDKTAHPEVSGLMTELIKSRKKLKELKLTQSTERGLSLSGEKHRTSTKQREASLTETEVQHVNNGNTKPSMEETINLMNNRLKQRRREFALPEAVKDMSHFQMNMEKTSLQKCLLHFESLHGRPSIKQEWTLVQPFYERYHLLKHLLLSSAATVITTIEEEEDSDEECTTQQPWLQSPRCVFSGESPDLQALAPLVSPLDEDKTLQLHSATVAKLHEASRSGWEKILNSVYVAQVFRLLFNIFRSELLAHFRTTRLEKRRLNRVLREFEEQFCTQTGRTCQKEDRGPMADEYCQYKNLKAKLRLLEALLSKRRTQPRAAE